jgi:predicted nucleotidyltransferase
MSDRLALRELLERLVAAEIRFVVIGGLAVNAWGHVRATRDLDIVPDPERANLDRLADLLEGLDGRVQVAEGKLGASAIRTFLSAGDRTLVDTSAGPVDVLQGMPQIPGFAVLDADAVDVDLDGLTVRICSLDALLKMKRASDRSRDREDLAALEQGRGPV